MNRRAFNTSLIGGAVAAAVPVPALSKVAATGAASPLYAWGVAIARAQNRASPALLAKQLGLSHAAAMELYASLLANGVIRAPLFGGLARATAPLFRGGPIAAADAGLGQSASPEFKRLKRMLDRVVEQEQADPKSGAGAAEDQAS